MGDTGIVGTTDIHWIVTKVLLNSSEICRQKSRFHGALELHPAHLVGLEKEEAYTFFSLTLSKWMETNGKKATFSCLHSTLKTEKFNTAADELSSEYKERFSHELWTTQIVRSEGDPAAADFRQQIQMNFVKLCSLTDISSRLLDRCVEMKVMTRGDVEMIEIIQIGYTKNRTFYEKLLKKDKIAFVKLIQIMEETETRQSSDVLNILRGSTTKIIAFPVE